MPDCGIAKIVCGDMQINLRARDEAMPKQVANGDQADAGANQMRCEGMTHAVRRQSQADTAALSPGADAFVNGAA